MSAEHWTDAAGLAAQTVEFWQVQRMLRGPGLRGDPPEWVDVPDAARADELEAFDLCDRLGAEWPATRYRVVRRWKGRT